MCLIQHPHASTVVHPTPKALSHLQKENISKFILKETFSSFSLVLVFKWISSVSHGTSVLLSFF